MMTMAMARILARVAHEGQKYGDGPYIAHVCRVVGRIEEDGGGTADVILAWLHDVVEDTNLTFIDLETFGYNTAALNAITRRKYDNYEKYILRVRSSPTALRVKIADLRDNLSHSAPLSLQGQYLRALETLRAW